MNRVDLVVALDRRALRRDLRLVAGDDFSIALTAYARDGDEVPADLADEDLQLVLWRGRREILRETGTPGLPTRFEIAGAATATRSGRWYWRVVSTLEGRSTTLAGGVLVVCDPEMMQ